MSSRSGARKSDEKYDAKQAYNKNLSGKARLHYLENDIHDKGMSMKSPMEMKSPMQVGPDAKSAKKKEYSFGEKALGTVKNIGNYAAAGASKILSGTAISSGKSAGQKSQMSYDQQRASDFQKGHLDSAKKRKKEGSAFFMESDGQEKQDLMDYNPIDDRAGMSMKSPAKQKGGRGDHSKMTDGEYSRHLASPRGKKEHGSPMKKSPMYDKGHQGDGDGHVHPRTQGEQDVMSKHINKFNDFTNKASKFGNMTEAQLQRVKDRQQTLNAQITKTRDSIGNVHRNFDAKRDADFDALFDDGK
tara:strand:- start:459 stop:1361 length:903 start_codon:yes stop_codon:yes gene_type:complete